jgi:hypothetical protein
MNALKFLPFISTFVTLLFVAAVFNRYRYRRGAHLLWWGLGLLLYAAGTFAEAWLGVAWSDPMLRAWYLTGAMLTAAWLGQGTVFLLIRRRGVALGLGIGLLIVSAIAVAGVWSARIDPAGFNPQVSVSTQYKALMERSGLTVVLTILLNIYGTVWLVGGAAWSAYLFARKQVLPHRVIGNVLIAVGALMPAGAGTLIRLGLGDWLYVSELIGAAIMFAGFVAATNPQPALAAQPAPTA